MFRSWGKKEPDAEASGSAAVKLIVGLGNPGRKYVGTRHNVGFRVIEELFRRAGGSTTKSKFQGEIADVRMPGMRTLLLSPHTFMNKSGTSVLAAKDFYKLELSDLLIVCDDFQLPLGALRARPHGSAGGQKGLDDVIRRLGSQQIPRLRIGIGPPREGWDVADFVLSRFGDKENEVIDVTIALAADASEMWAAQGMEACMNGFNRAR